MLQRTTILDAWEGTPSPQAAVQEASTTGRRRGGAASASQQRAQTFMAMVREQEALCWEDLVAEFRQNYYDSFAELIPPLFATDDPLIIHNCIRFADLNQPREVEILKQFIRSCDPEKHQVSLRALAERGQPELTAELKKRKDLPQSVRESIG